MRFTKNFDIHYQTKNRTNNLRDLIEINSTESFQRLQGHTLVSAELWAPRRSISITYSAAFEEKSCRRALWLIHLEAGAPVAAE